MNAGYDGKFYGEVYDLKAMGLSLKGWKIKADSLKKMDITKTTTFTLEDIAKSFGGNVEPFKKVMGIPKDQALAKAILYVDAGYQLFGSGTSINNYRAELYGGLKVDTCYMMPTPGKALEFLKALKNPNFGKALGVLKNPDFVNQIKGVFMSANNKGAINALKNLQYGDSQELISLFTNTNVRDLIDDILTNPNALGDILTNPKYQSAQYQDAINILKKPQFEKVINAIKTSGSALTNILMSPKYKELIDIFTNPTYRAISGMLMDPSNKGTITNIAKTGLDSVYKNLYKNLFTEKCDTQFPKKVKRIT